jgi:hypothetical protein
MTCAKFQFRKNSTVSSLLHFVRNDNTFCYGGGNWGGAAAPIPSLIPTNLIVIASGTKQSVLYLFYIYRCFSNCSF